MRPPLLHNIGPPPRTPVQCLQVSVHGPPVLFSLGELIRASLGGPADDLQRKVHELGAENLDEAELRALLTACIPAPGLEAALADPSPPLQGVLIGFEPTDGSRLLVCTDLALTLRVLSRCEAGLYLGHRPPSGELRDLARRRIAFDDPSLAAWPCLAPHSSTADPGAEAAASAQQPSPYRNVSP